MADKQINPHKYVTSIRIDKLLFDVGRVYIERNGSRYDNEKKEYFPTSITHAFKEYIHPRKKDRRKQHFFYPTISITINTLDKTFSFNDFDLSIYLNKMFGVSGVQVSNHKTDKPINRQIPLSENNIEFYDGYYEVFITKGGVKDKTIKSKIFKTIYSSSSLHLLKKELLGKLPSGVKIAFTNKEVIGLSQPLNLEKYISIISRSSNNIFEDVPYIRKTGIRTLDDCIKNTKKASYYKSQFRSPYLNYLFSLMDEEKLVLAYENNHGKEEDAFMIPIPLPKGRFAIVFENVSADSNTTTEVFISAGQDYKQCLQAIFDYFTDDDILIKRDILRRKMRKPNEFHAIKYNCVDHDDYEVWRNGMYKIIHFLS